MTGLERVKFQGGRLHGAVLEMSPRLAKGVHDRDLVITEAGRVYERRHGQLILMPTIRVVRPPLAQLPAVTDMPGQRL